jgi:hypothetical protein
MKLMHEFTGVVDAPPSQVEDRLRARLPGFAPVAPGVFALQGGWWYRGEYHVKEEAGGSTRLVYRIYNVAGPGSRWAVPLANRFFIGFAETTGATFRQLLADLR